LVSVEKELQQVKKDNTALARYINGRRKKEVRKKAEEDARRKAMVVAPTSDEGQSLAKNHLLREAWPDPLGVPPGWGIHGFRVSCHCSLLRLLLTGTVSN
jgi:hypothetical protein